MRRTIHYFVATTLLMLLASTLTLADIQVELIKGKRSINDKVTFTIEVSHEKDENPRYKEKPDFIQISVAFAGPASGAIALDGMGVQRFDGTATVEGQRTEITYGRHTVTLQVSEPAVATRLAVFVRGGLVREVIGEAPAAPGGGLDQRVAELERKVRQLEAEVEVLKKR